MPGATPRFDDDGREIIDVATCGQCGRSWNDAATSSLTPVPSGRCPFEYEHEDADADAKTYRTDVRYDFDAQNESRADRAEWALAVATDRSGESDASETHLDVSDLLGNLMHFCVRAGLDFDEMVASAKRAAEGDLEDGPETKRDTDRFPA